VGLDLCSCSRGGGAAAVELSCEGRVTRGWLHLTGYGAGCRPLNDSEMRAVGCCLLFLQTTSRANRAIVSPPPSGHNSKTCHVSLTPPTSQRPTPRSRPHPPSESH